MSNMIPKEQQPLSGYWIINRIGDMARTPRCFNESHPFSEVVPYRVTNRDVFSKDDVPLHYAPSLEVVLYENLSGHVVVDNQHVSISNNTCVINPPLAVHGGWVTSDTAAGSRIYCLQVSMEQMAHYLQLENFFDEKGIALENAPVVIPEFDAIRNLMDDLVRYDDNVFLRNIAILSIFEIIARYIPSTGARTDVRVENKEALKAIISWSHDNFDQRITLDEAAAVVGFSKHYFCKWFKKQTGSNYFQYLKRIRVYNASMLLLSGQSVSEAGYASGFENISYFIKCFKEIRGCPPKRFVEVTRMHIEG